MRSHSKTRNMVSSVLNKIHEIPREPPLTYLYSICVVIQKEDSWTGHFLGFHHGLQISQQTHMLGHICCQDLYGRENDLSKGSHTKKPIFYLRVAVWAQVIPCQSPSSSESDAVSWSGSGRCHSALLEAVWNPQQDGGSPRRIRRCTSGLVQNLAEQHKYVTPGWEVRDFKQQTLTLGTEMFIQMQ